VKYINAHAMAKPQIELISCHDARQRLGRWKGATAAFQVAILATGLFPAHSVFDCGELFKRLFYSQMSCLTGQFSVGFLKYP